MSGILAVRFEGAKILHDSFNLPDTSAMSIVAAVQMVLIRALVPICVEIAAMVLPCHATDADWQGRPRRNGPVPRHGGEGHVPNISTPLQVVAAQPWTGSIQIPNPSGGLAGGPIHHPHATTAVLTDRIAGSNAGRTLDCGNPQARRRLAAQVLGRRGGGLFFSYSMWDQAKIPGWDALNARNHGFRTLWRCKMNFRPP